MEDIEPKDSSNSKLQIGSLFSIRILHILEVITKNSFFRKLKMRNPDFDSAFWRVELSSEFNKAVNSSDAVYDKFWKIEKKILKNSKIEWKIHVRK